MKEKNINIWKRKLDWIAEHDGMALMLTHPDYMCFSGRCARDEYPAGFYKEMLEYLHARYNGMYWLALPREAAQFVAGAVRTKR
jgi:hypothetical protein